MLKVFVIFLLAFGMIANYWHIGRQVFSQAPEMRGDRWLTLAFAMLGAVVPQIGCFTGWWYMLFGPTRQRSAERIRTYVNELGVGEVCELITNQLSKGDVGREEVFKRWLGMGAKARNALVAANFDAYRLRLIDNITAYQHGKQVEVDWVGPIVQYVISKEG